MMQGKHKSENSHRWVVLHYYLNQESVPGLFLQKTLTFENRLINGQMELVKHTEIKNMKSELFIWN